MSLAPIHDPAEGPLRTVALMSGSGTNVRRILEAKERLDREEGGPLFEVAVIFSDCYDSAAAEIGRDFDVPVLTHDLKGWMARRGVKRSELRKREGFDRENARMLEPFNVRVAIYGGYMAIASPTLINAFIGVNVHPADLTIKNPDGSRKFVGAHGVRDAIAAGQKTLRSTTHLVIDKVDAGPILMLSDPVPVEIPEGADLADPKVLDEVADMNQERLKQAGDWKIFPKTIEDIARGYYQRDEKGRVFYRGKAVY